jgi:ABC-type transport system involved in multi-copper enzyme maturation permease subunit
VSLSPQAPVASAATPTAVPLRELIRDAANWQRWLRQMLVLVRMDLLRHFFTRRAIWLHLLALAPVGITGIYYLVQLFKGPRGSLGNDTLAYAGIFQILYLRFLIFFGSLAVCTYLVRGEVLGKTLHFYFLLPLRRDVFLLSRYLVGVLATSTVFLLSVTASYFLIMMHRGSEFWTFLLQGQGLVNLFDYWMVTVLACAGYGAVFLLASLYVRNPLIPGAVVFVWEAINVFLPSLLQKASVIYYLKSLSPVDVPMDGALALIVVPPEPISRAIAVAGLLVLSAALLTLGARRIQRTEIDYTD